MSADNRWARVDAVLQSALSRPTHERDAFVRSACVDDDSVRDEVLSLLAHASGADQYLEPAPARQPLQSGQRLGAYEILGLIGAGGMGEVYRATDSRLRRTVAIKILPPEADDEERRQRFAREAQAVAALNHPGIVTIYSIEESDGVRFLTMELVEGRTLDTLIPTGGLAIARVLELAISFADAVGAAHARGIIHRDLKPGNVMVTAEGRVKVLDFGLAKLTRPEFDSAAATTFTGRLTVDGRVLGTLAYMSPEQAEGREVDHRSDIFSIGVLLYELASGRRPFTGDSNVALLASIVKDTPVALNEVKPDVPADFAKIVRRCLAKDPGRRYQSVIDIRNHLEELDAELESPIAPATRTPIERRQPAWLKWIAAMATLVLAAGVYMYWPGRGAAGGTIRFEVLPPGDAIDGPIDRRRRSSGALGAPGSPPSEIAVAPDGSALVFNGVNVKSPIWIRRLDAESKPLPGTEGGHYPFWSPDSRSIGFFVGGELKRVDVDGGPPVTICEVAQKAALSLGRGGAWLENGTIVFAELEFPGLKRVNARGGDPETLVTFEQGRGFTGYRFPVAIGQRRFLYYAAALDHSDSEVRWSSLDAPDKYTAVVRTPRIAAYASGMLFFHRDGMVVAKRFDPASGALSGAAISIGPAPPDSRPVGNMAFSAGGRTLAWITDRESISRLMWLDRRGTSLGEIAPARQYGRMTLSPDDKWIATSVSGRLWIIDAASGHGQSAAGEYPVLFTSSTPQWSPDGNRIAFESTRGVSGFINLYSVAVSRPDAVVPLVEAPIGPLHLVDWAATEHVMWLQDRSITYDKPIPGAEDWMNLRGLLSQMPGGTERPVLISTITSGVIAVAPDASAIAYTRQVAGRWDICLDPVPAATACESVAWSGSDNPGSLRWRQDGTELFIRVGDTVRAVSIRRSGTRLVSGKIQHLFDTPGTVGLAVTSDGQRFLVRMPVDDGLRWITGIANWSPPAVR